MPRTSSEDIRAWGAENGWDVSGDRLPSGLRAAYDGRETSADEGVSETEPTDNGERPPSIVKESPVSKARSMVERVRSATPKTTRRKGSSARVSVENLVSGAWRVLARFAETMNPPVSRVLEMQAPVAGMILEEKVAGTLADTILQPVAKFTSGGETAMALIGPPLLVAAITARPDRQAVLVPMLKASLRSWVRVAGKHLEKIEAEENDFEEKYGMRINEMVDSIFAPTANEHTE